MKIVITNHEFRAHFPPRIKYFYEEAKRQGHEVHIIELYGISICYQFSNDKQANKDWEILFPKAKTGAIKFEDVEKRLNERLDAINPDVVMSGIATFPVGIIALRWAKRNNRGIVEFGNAKKNTFKHNCIVHQVKRMMFRNVDAFFCPSDKWDESMIFWGFKKEEIFYGLNVTNTHDWEGDVHNIHFTNLPKQYMLTCGRQVYMKNLPRLVKCYQRYCREGGKLPLIMVGEGVKHDELVNLANGNPNIIFLPYQPHEKMKELFLQMKCLMLPSFREETWGIVVNEAMAAGRIAACSIEAGCTTTIIENNVNGFCFDPYNEDDMVMVMHNIEALPEEKLREMQAKAKATIQDWGVGRFAKGALEACHYAINHKKKICNPFDRLLIKLWKGRMTIKNE